MLFPDLRSFAFFLRRTLDLEKFQVQITSTCFVLESAAGWKATHHGVIRSLPLAPSGAESAKISTRPWSARRGVRAPENAAAPPRQPHSLHFSRPCPMLNKGSDGQLHSPPEGGGGRRDDAQAGMPSDEPRAQLAFKNSMIRGILQFTLRIAFRCVLHRCESQDIRC